MSLKQSAAEAGFVAVRLINPPRVGKSALQRIGRTIVERRSAQAWKIVGSSWQSVALSSLRTSLSRPQVRLRFWAAKRFSLDALNRVVPKTLKGTAERRLGAMARRYVDRPSSAELPDFKGGHSDLVQLMTASSP